MPAQVGAVQLDLSRAAHRHKRGGGHFAQLGGHLAAGAVFDQLAGQLLFHALGLFASGQQQVAFHLHQTGGHFNEFAGNLHALGAQPVNDGGVLLNQLQNGNVVQVHLVFAYQIEQQVQRAVKLSQMKG